MAKTRECCGALLLRRTGDDLHVSLHKGFKIRLAGIVPVFIEFTGSDMETMGDQELISGLAASEAASRGRRLLEAGY